MANACATGATALRTAIMAVKAGEVDMGWPSGSRSWPVPGSWPGGQEGRRGHWTPSGRYGAVASIDGRVGTETMPGVFAQIGMEYLFHNEYAGTAFELFARISEKNHAHSTLNPLAAYTKAMSLEQIMGDVMIAYPNTRPMCSANCDGAAAAVVVRRLDAEDAVEGATTPGGEGVGVDPDHRPLGRGLPGAAQREHADQECRPAGL